MASFVKADSWWALLRRNLPFSVGESGNWVYPFIDLFFDKFNPRRCERNVEAWFKFKTHFPSFLRGISFQHSNFALPSKHWNFSSASSFTQNLNLNLILFRNNSSHFNIFFVESRRAKLIVDNLFLTQFKRQHQFVSLYPRKVALN